ncbi:phosphatase 2C-like domain-containing protein, partial [Phycomyces blakesleeanus]
MDRTSNRAYFGIFDGLANSLHERIETVSLDDLPELLKRLRAFGGYFKRFKIPGIFKNLVDQEGRRLSGVTDTDMSVEQRIMLGFLMSDVYCIDSLLKTDGKQQEHEGSTGSIAIVEPHDDRAFWESQRYDIIVGHVGDTRILVCDSCSGEAVALTTGDHHPGNPLEQERLRKLAGYVTTDSWGDDRILGLLATSRAFGDSKLKRYGVSSEPDIVLVTDGVTSVMSDQEVVDIVKQYKDPTTSAKHIVDICDQFGSEDNITAVVVRLKDWGARMNDLTLDLRKYRLANSPMNDALAATQSLEEELLGQGYLMETPLGSSLAAELQSATSPLLNASRLTSLAMENNPLLFDVNGNNPGIMSPLQWNGVGIGAFGANYGRSRRSSFSSTWSSLDQEDYDPFEALKKQLEELNSAVWETKTLHKRLLNTLVADEALQ